MYRNRKNYLNSSNRKFIHGNSRHINKLDPSLFIKKATLAGKNTKQVSIYSSNKNNGFSNFLITDKLITNIKNHGYETPTEIQNKAIPDILAGRDIIGIANTGTGKTAAFLISLINKSYLDRNQRVLIVVPTRELAMQIKDEYKIFAKGTGLESVAVVGGISIKRQSHELKHKPHFVIGTPGRLKDLISRKELNLQLFQNVVLDEVDKMVDIGFIHDIKLLISYLPKIRQSLFFSATIDSKTRDILNNFVINPVTIKIKSQNSSDNIDQDIIKFKDKNSKVNLLHDLLIQPGFDKVLVFGRTKWGIQKLTYELVDRGFKASVIHGNKTQNQRQRALYQFKNNEVQILLATDVASRGLDIENVTHVINYDPPETFEDYIHRIGRTGRAGKTGKALTFVEY